MASTISISEIPNGDEIAHVSSPAPTERLRIPSAIGTIPNSSPTQPAVLFSEHQNEAAEIINTPIPARFRSQIMRRTYTYRTRVLAPSTEKSYLRVRRLQNANRSDNPFEQHRICCKKLKCFTNVDPICAFHWYREIMVMDREEVKATLLSWYNAGFGKFTFNGRKVCWRFLNRAFEFSNDFLCAVNNTECARAAQTSFAQPRDTRRGTLRDSIISFLRITANDMGDEMPHRNFINLPATNKKQVYEAYLAHFKSKDPLRFTRMPPKISYFYFIWKKYVRDVKAMKNIGFEKCSECVFYQEERAKHILNPSVLRQLKEASNRHYDSMAEETRGYDMGKLQACREPQHYLSMVIDGADQSSYGLPQFLHKSKEDKGHKIAVKVVGALIHGV